MKRNKGFSLIELIVGIVILGVLSGITALSYSSFTYAQKEKRDNITADSLTLLFEDILLDSDVLECYKDNRGSVITLYWVDEQIYNGSCYTSDTSSLVCSDTDARAGSIFNAMNLCLSSENLPSSETNIGFTLEIDLNDYEPKVLVETGDNSDIARIVSSSEKVESVIKPYEPNIKPPDKITNDGDKDADADGTLIKGANLCSKLNKATKVVFTDKKQKRGSYIEDLTVEGNLGIVGWYDGSTYYISTRKSGVKVKANKDCSCMFSSLSSLTSVDFSNLDTSEATNFSNMFALTKSLVSVDLSPLDASKVVTMSSMFSKSNSLISVDLSGLKTSEDLKDLNNMFSNCPVLREVRFDTSFDARGVTDMSFMFSEDSLLEDLYMSDVVTRDISTMNNMFSGCSKIKKIDLSNFHLQYISAMTKTFYCCTMLEKIDLSKSGENLNGNPVDSKGIYSMTMTFRDCHYLTSIDFGSFNPINVGYLNHTFNTCPRLSQETLDSVFKWDLKNLKELWYTFSGAHGSDIVRRYDLSNWGGNIEAFGCTFSCQCNCHYNKVESINFGNNFNTSNCTTMLSLFRRCLVKSLDLTKFDTGNVDNFSSMFDGCYMLEEIKGIEDFDFSSAINTPWMFGGVKLITSLDLSNCKVSKDAKLKYMQGMFSGMSNLTDLKLPKFNTSKVLSFVQLFHACSNLKSIDLSSFDTSSCTTFENMFAYCHNITELDVSKFNTENAVNFTKMFASCTKLESLDVSKFITENATNMSYMFSDCWIINDINFNNFDTSNVTVFDGMFKGYRAYVKGDNTLNLVSFDTGKATSAIGMFASRDNEKDKSGFGISEIIVSKDFTFRLGAGKGENMFRGRTNLVNYDESKVGVEKAVYSDLGTGGYLTRPK